MINETIMRSQVDKRNRKRAKCNLYDTRGRWKMSKVKRSYYETGVAMLDFFRGALWTKQKCRIVINYDPAEEMVEIEKTVIESEEHGSLPESQTER